MISFHLGHILQSISSFLSSERGQALAEYSLILGFIAVVCVVALTAIGVAVAIPFGDVASGMGFGGVDPAPAPTPVTCC